MSESDEELEGIKEKKLKEMLQSVKGGDQMSMRVVIPVLDEKGLGAQLSEHFGRAPYFAVVDLDKDGNVSNSKPCPTYASISAAQDNVLTVSATQTKRNHHLWNGSE